MSLHQLANHMSARGRGPDSMLVHMTPREVAGLQSLAVANGTSLTINPDTGLPEAFSLKDLLPTLAGAAINYFAPGFGEAIGGAIGLSGAAGTGLAVGAATAALSGDLGKGLSAGLGAYGGAGITDSLAGMGTGYLGSQAAESAVADATARGLTGEAYDKAIQDSVTNRMASAKMSDKLGAGLSYAGSNPMTALKTGAKYLAAAAAPSIFAGEVGNTVQTVTPRQSTGMIRPYRYDPYSQTFAEGTPYAAANGGLMGLAHGGAVHYEEGGPVGAAAAPFDSDAWLRNYVKQFEPPAATGAGFAATPAAQAPVAQAPVAQAPVAQAPVAQAPVAQSAPAQGFTYTSGTAPTAATNTGAGIAALSNAGAATSSPAGAGNATGNIATGAGLGINYAGQATSPLITDQVFDLFKDVLDRPPSENDMKYWATQFGINNNKVDPNEIADFKSAASKEIAARQASDSGKDYILNTDANRNKLYMQYLSRQGEYGTGGKEGGMEFWKRTFGDYIDPKELAGFQVEAAKERAAREKATRPDVVTDITKADPIYVKEGVGGATGAGQIGGGTVVNSNGTITTSPRIPGIPVGGFEGMKGVQDAYTKGGGDLGYTSPTYTEKTFADKYKNTGYDKEMYEYLMGKGEKPTKMKNADGTYQEIMRPYTEAALGVPGSTNKRLTWDKVKGEYNRNPNYVRTERAPILDATGKPKLNADGNYLYNTTTYKSINQAKAGIADNKLTKDSGSALLDWATTNNVDEQTVADALGIPMQEVISMFAKAKADKKIPAKNGGLMQLANGGMAYDVGGAVKADYIDSKGDTHVWDWENGIYRPQKLFKNNKSYTWDKAANEYKVAGAGITDLLDKTGDMGRGNDAINPGWDSLTPEQKAQFYDENPTLQSITLAGQKALSFLGITNPLQAAIARGTASLIGSGLGGSNQAAKEADALPSNTTGLPQGYDTAASRSGIVSPGVTARDAVTSANSPTATGGKANSPAGLSALAVAAAAAAAEAAPEAEAETGFTSLAQGQLNRDATVAAKMATENSLIDAAQKEATDKTAAFSAALAAMQAQQAKNVADAANVGGTGNNAVGTGGGFNDGGGGGGTYGGGVGDCVDPSTLILLANGTQIPAGGLKVGDFLHTLHEDTFVYGDFEVVYVKTVQQPKNIVTFTDGHNLTASDSHKFLMSNRTWKRVDALEAGDTIETAKGVNSDGFKTVAKIEAIGLGDVVKLTIDNAHTYISEGLVSHNKDMAYGGMVGYYAQGGLGSLGGYSDGGRLLRGPGDGVSDSIPASIGDRQPARLADGEFVVPARIVSELGNGSTEAGARALYKMMDRIQANRRKTTGKNSVAVDSKAHKYLPA